MHSIALVLGAALTLVGAAMLVIAYRHGQLGRRDQERRTFRLAVGLFAAGSVTFVAATAAGAAGV